MKKFGLLFAILILANQITWGQIAAWQLNGATGNEVSINATTLNANLNTSTLSRGSGLNVSALANAYGSTNYTASGTKANAISSGKYILFTLNAKVGYQLSLTTLDVRFRRSSTGPNAFRWQYSTDGTNFIDIGINDISYTATTTGGDAQTQINLSGISALQNVMNSTTITIRLLGWGATATTGTFAIGRSLTSGPTDYSLAIGGTVTPTVSIPTITATPTTLSGFTYVVGSGPSVSQSYDLSGSNLTGFPDNITVTGSANYEVSTDNSTFGGSVNVPYTSATLSSTPIYVRLKSGLSVGDYNGDLISNTGGGAATQNVTCDGSVLPDIVITEINDHPTYVYEYVEIFNNSFSSVDLTGWRLLQLNSTQTTTLVDAATNVFEGSLNLAAGAYAIIFRGSSTDFANFKTAYNITGTINAYTNDKTGSSSGSPLINGDETFKLEDNSGNLIDYFGDYLGGTSPAFSVTVGSLYERKDYPNDGTFVTHWYTLASTSLGGTPAEANENPMPVELTSFSATTLGSTVKLSWNTATEVNNYGFEIERNTPLNPLSRGEAEGRGVWEKIGFVNGNGNSNSPKSYSFVDEKVDAGKYSYRLKQIDNDGQFEYSKTIEVDLGAPKKFELSQNYPNPFNPSTTINYNLPEAGNVKLIIYNILGQEIRTLVNEFKEAGVHTINFNASELNSGLYIYKIETGSFTQTRKMTLVK